LYAQIKSVSAPSTTLRGFSWLPLAATLRVNVMVVFPPLKEQVAPATTDPLLGVVRPVDQYRFTASGLPEQITISVLVMLVPTPSPTQPSPLYVTVNVAVVLSEDRATLAVTCEPNAFVFDASEALGDGDVALGDGDVALGDGDVALGEGDVALGEGDVALGEGDAALGDGDVALTFVSAICCLLSWALPPVAVVPTDTVTLDKLEMSLGAVQTNVVGAEVHRFIVLVQPFAFPPCIVPADTCTKP